MKILLKDQRGVPVSTTNPKSLERLEQACDLMNGYFNDPFAIIDAKPEFDLLDGARRVATNKGQRDVVFVAPKAEHAEIGIDVDGRGHKCERGHALPSLSAFPDLPRAFLEALPQKRADPSKTKRDVCRRAKPGVTPPSRLRTPRAAARARAPFLHAPASC